MPTVEEIDIIEKRFVKQAEDSQRFADERNATQRC